MKFSIITVCYNSEKTIIDTLRSVDSQTYFDYEHIIIDGLSSDNTIKICKSIANINRKIISESDKGIFDAMNKGISLSKGEYIIFLNSDDKFFNNGVLSYVNKNLNNECIIYGDILISKGEKIHRKWISGHYTTNSFKLGWMPPHTGTFIKKKIILENKIFYNLNYNISADYDYLIRAFKVSKKIKYINSYVTNMQLGGNSNANLASSLKKKYQDYLIIKRNNLGGLYTLVLKSLTKIKQLI